MDKSRGHLSSGRPADQPSIFSMFAAQRRRQGSQKESESKKDVFPSEPKKDASGPSAHSNSIKALVNVPQTHSVDDWMLSDDEDDERKAKPAAFEEMMASDEEAHSSPIDSKKRRRVIVEDSSGEEFSSEAEEDEEESDDFENASNFSNFPPPLASTRSTLVSNPSKESFIPGFVRASTSVGSSAVKKQKLGEIPSAALHELDASDSDQGDGLEAFFEYLATQKAKNAIQKDRGKSESRLIRRVSYRYSTGLWKVESLDPSEEATRWASGESNLKNSDELLSGSHLKVDNDVIYLEVRHGDLTAENVDVVVNAANSFLAHGGGVAGAMVSRGGRIVQKESDEWVRQMGDVATGEVGITGGGKLRAGWIIHAVGPVYTAAPSKQALLDQELYNAVFNSLKMANSVHVKAKSIAFPAISSGIFGFPKERVAKILFSAAMKFFVGEVESSKGSSSSSTSAIQSPPDFLRIVRFTNFDMPTVEYFKDTFDDLFHPHE
jgi:putative ATPase